MDLHMKPYHLNHGLLSLHELKYFHYSVTHSFRGRNNFFRYCLDLDQCISLLLKLWKHSRKEKDCDVKCLKAFLNLVLLWGLESVHMIATCGRFWSITQKAWNFPDGVLLVSPWVTESRSYKKNKLGTSHITHHTSHRTHCIWIWSFIRN